VDPFEEVHAATVWQIVVGDVSRIVGIPHGSQCSSSDANRANSDDGRRAHVMHQTVVTLVSAHLHDHEVETPVGTWVRPAVIKNYGKQMKVVVIKCCVFWIGTP
jgi:hypothetical protein